jgi:hypothetical protein
VSKNDRSTLTADVLDCVSTMTAEPETMTLSVTCPTSSLTSIDVALPNSTLRPETFAVRKPVAVTFRL